MVEYLITSPETPDYNCIAWAAEDNARWWEPDPMGDYYWPEAVPRKYTLESYILAYKALGYEICTDTKLEEGYKKIAIYVMNDGRPTHAARQLRNGNWISKFGECFDAEHDCVTEWSDAIVGVYPLSLSAYGKIGAILRKPTYADQKSAHLLEK